ncbi:MAG: type II secretion system protein GspC [Pseudomonadota bacterium]
MNTLASIPDNVSSLTRLSTPINVVLALLIGYALASIVLGLLDRPTSSTAPVTQNTSGNARAASPQQVASQIANAHLFGRATAKPVVKEEPVQQDAPETKLNLTLHGVLAYDPPENALAIISSGGQRETIYAIGDKIVGNTTLRAVHADRVIIRRSGKDETLRLPEKVAALGNVQTSSTTTSAASSSASAGTDLPTDPKELRDRLVKEPSMMADLVTMRPYKRDGQLIGFRIQPRKNPELLRSFGIEAGDVITSVNGTPLTSNREGITALSKLRKATSVDLLVLRAGAEIPISVSLE